MKQPKKHYKSVFENEPELLKALIDIHLDGKDIDVDPMYFKGNLYKDGVNRPKYVYDINPQVDYCKVGDAEKLENFLPEQVGSIMLDPPFLIGNRPSQKKYYSAMTHTMFPAFYALESCYKNIIISASRCLKKNGVLFFKCQDYTDSKTIMTHVLVCNWAEQLGFYAKDLAILVKPNKVTNPNTKQRHLRKIHTYFWVFIKK